MNKPIPKEMTIRNLGNGLLWITTSTPDAHNTVKRLAPQFGSYFPPGNPTTHHTLFVSDTYNTDEVMAYLEQEI